MLVLISKEKLQAFLQEDIKCWEHVGGGPNINAFDFNPVEVDPKVLEELGYFDNRDSWIAGARIKCIREYLDELSALPQFTGK